MARFSKDLDIHRLVATGSCFSDGLVELLNVLFPSTWLRRTSPVIAQKKLSLIKMMALKIYYTLAIFLKKMFVNYGFSVC